MASEEKAPSDRLYETGCVLCGTTAPVSNFGQLAGRSGGPHKGSAYCSEHRGEFGGTDGIDAEITRRKSLRASQPSDEREGPQVGETWLVRLHDGREETRTILRPGQGWGGHASWIFTTENPGSALWRDGEQDGQMWTLIRRLTPAASPERKVEKVAARVDPPAAKLDPTGRYPHTGFPSALDLEKHASVRDHDIATIKQHLADLDRGKAERLRNIRNWPEAWSTAGDES